MRISKQQLRRIIREEAKRALHEMDEQASDVLYDIASNRDLSGGVAIRGARGNDHLVIAPRGYPELVIRTNNSFQITANVYGPDGDVYKDSNTIRSATDLFLNIDERERYNISVDVDSSLTTVRVIISSNRRIPIDDLTDAKSIEILVRNPTVEYSPYNLFRI